MSSNEDKKSVFSYSKLLNYFKSTFFVAGVALATFVWILDPFIDVVFLQEGTNISQQVLHPDAHVAYMRSIISMGIIIFSFIVSVFFSHSKQVEEALLKSEASLKEAQHMTKIGSWELDLITNTLYWSDEVYRIFELEPQQFVATYEAFLEHIHPDDQELVDKAYADSVKNKAPYDIVHRLLLKDGTIKFINERCQTFYNDDGIAVRSVGTIQDITERKQAENALSKSEKKYRDLMEYSPDSMVIVNAKGKIELVNQQLQKMTGYTPDDLIGQAVETLILERFKDHKQLRDSYIANPSIRTMGEGVDLFVQRKDGREFPVEISLSPLETATGINISVAIRDITERKQVAEKLRESNERFRAAFADAAIGMTLVSLDHIVIEANQAFCEMLGYSKEELVGVLLRDITHPDDVATSLDYHQKLITGELDNYHFEKRYVHKLGHEVCGFLSVSMVRDNIGTALYAVAQIQDITDRKKSDEQLRQSESKLRALAAEISVAEERERRRIAVELHDNVIQDLGLCKIKLGELREKLPTKDSEDVLDELREIVGKSIKESRTLVFELSSPILYELGLEAAIKWLAEEKAEKLGFICQVEVDEQVMPITIERQEFLYKAVRELLINIGKHAQATEVNIYISRVDDEISIGVKDNGIGFDPESIELDDGGNKHFGLFGIKERLSLLQGDVTIKSSPGQGTSVILTAPLELSD